MSASPLKDVPILASILPQHGGFLPLWLLITAIASTFNTYKSFTTMFYSRRLFAGPLPSSTNKPASPSSAQKISIPASHPLHDHWPVPPAMTGPTPTLYSPITPFGARSFGSWNLLSAVIRFYAAYNIDNRQVYEMVMWSYAISTAFVCGEVWIYGTARVRSGWFTIVMVGVPSFIWTTTGWYRGWYF